MSGEAMGWAMKHRTGNGHVSHVLLRLAMRADEVGAMTLVNADYLADVCEISRATVFRALGKLRDLGLLETEVTHSRAGGRSVSARLILSAPPMRAAMQETHGEDDASDEAEEAASLTVRLAETAPVSQCDDLSLTVRLASLLEDNINNNNPPNPPSDEAVDKGEREGDDLEAWFKKFIRSYPFDETMHVSKARAAAEALSARDRAKALRWAPFLADAIKRRGGTRPPDAARWLRDRGFDEIERLHRERATAQGLSNPKVFVAKGTPAWDAWLKAGHKPSLDFSEHAGKRGWWFLSCYPPGADPPVEATAAVAG